MFEYDALIVGAGGAGLYAALEASKAGKTAVLSKLFPSGPILERHKVALALPWGTSRRTSPNGMPLTPSRGETISPTKMPQLFSPKKLFKLFTS